jgi:ABC-type oligopeptide transport system substrate-binding subunit
MRFRRALTAPALIAAAFLAAGCGGDDEADEAASSTDALRIVIGSEPPSLDPGLITDVVSANIALNLMDPLVRLDDDLQPQAELAERWDVSEDGKTVTFHLREDGKWTNGDPVTAGDFEYAWKRILDPELAAGYAYQLYGIVGATEYNSCESGCDKLRDAVGVKAVDDRTFEVQLTSPQPWFIAQVAHTSFLPVHRATVEEFGDKWTEPGNIVTNGPYRLTGWKHDASITLTKWGEWRDADSVSVDRIAGRIIKDATTALAAFEAGEVDACMETSCIPPGDIERLQEGDAYVQSPGLATQYLGLNLASVPDVNQRRALAFAVDRTSIVENVTKAGEEPATSFTPKGMPGFETIAQDFLPTTADLDAAREYLGKAKAPKTTLQLAFVSDDPVGKDMAVAVQAMWKELGITTRLRGIEFQQFLEMLGPPLDKTVDVFAIGWVGDYVDDINFLELWTCKSGNNPTGYCDEEYDALIEKARQTPDDTARHAIYADAEAMLTGPEGALPIIPTHWATFPTMRKPGIEGWQPNLLDQYDFTEVTLPDE